MNRRRFLSGTAAGIAAAGMDGAKAAGPPVLMKLGCQSAPTNEKHVAFLARYGVRNICGYPQIADGRLFATVDELKRMQDTAQKFGVAVDCVAPPFLESSHIDRERHPAIMLAESPERDREIDQRVFERREIRPAELREHVAVDLGNIRADVGLDRPSHGGRLLRHLLRGL